MKIMKLLLVAVVSTLLAATLLTACGEDKENVAEYKKKATTLSTEEVFDALVGEFVRPGETEETTTETETTTEETTTETETTTEETTTEPVTEPPTTQPPTEAYYAPEPYYEPEPYYAPEPYYPPETYPADEGVIIID